MPRSSCAVTSRESCSTRYELFGPGGCRAPSSSLLIWTSIAHTISLAGWPPRRRVRRCVLVLERLDLLRDVLGERVERGYLLLRGLAQLLELRERAEALLDVLHQFDGRVCLVVRFVREILEPPEILRQLTGHRAQLLDPSSAPRCVRATSGSGLCLLHMAAEFVERRLILLEAGKAVARLQRFRRQVLDGLSVFLELAVRSGEARGFLLGLVTESARDLMRASIASSSLTRAAAWLSRPVTSSSFVCAWPALSSTSCSDLLAVESLALCSCTCVSIVLSAARSSLEAAIRACSSSDCSFVAPLFDLNASSMVDLYDVGRRRR